MNAAYLCKCGHLFGESLGALGCPNCCGSSGPARPTAELANSDIVKLARQAGGTAYVNRHYPDQTAMAFSNGAIELFSAMVIAAFLERSGQYVTNEASRAAAIAEAVAAEREACAEICDDAAAAWSSTHDCAIAIRARGAP